MGFTNLSCSCLELFKTAEDEDVRIEMEECFDTLLDSWVILLADPVSPIGRYHKSNFVTFNL